MMKVGSYMEELQMFFSYCDEKDDFLYFRVSAKLDINFFQYCVVKEINMLHASICM